VATSFLTSPKTHLGTGESRKETIIPLGLSERSKRIECNKDHKLKVKQTGVRMKITLLG
jgi:hypothetical protein